MAKMQSKNLSKPDEVRAFDKGKVEVVTLGGVTFGRARLEPAGHVRLVRIAGIQGQRGKLRIRFGPQRIAHELEPHKRRKALR